MHIKTLSKIMRLIICVLLIVCLSGCWSAREINDLEIVIGIGMDQDEDPDTILMTAQVVKSGEMRNPSPESAPGGNQAFWNVRSAGQTVFDAVRAITHQTGNRLFFSHSQILIFSDKIAEQGVDKYIDFFLRAHEMRPSTLIFVSENEAAEVLDVKPEKEKLPAMNISKIIRSARFTSYTKEIDLQEFSNRMMSKTAAPIAPLIKVSNEEGEEKVYISGLAVFKDFKMAGTLDSSETRGYLWALGEIKSGIIHVPTPSGDGVAALEINKAKSKITPIVKDDKIEVQIKIEEMASITEQSSHESLVTIEAIETMQKNQAEIIREEITKAFEKSKELKCDIFGFGEMIRKKHLSKWKEMEKNWDEIYQSIELVLDIETNIQKTELITKPIFSKEE